MKGWSRIRTEVIATVVITVTPKHPYNAGRGKSVPRALSLILWWLPGRYDANSDKLDPCITFSRSRITSIESLTVTGRYAYLLLNLLKTYIWMAECMCLLGFEPRSQTPINSDYNYTRRPLIAVEKSLIIAL